MLGRAAGRPGPGRAASSTSSSCPPTWCGCTSGSRPLTWLALLWAVAAAGTLVPRERRSVPEPPSARELERRRHVRVTLELGHVQMTANRAAPADPAEDRAEGRPVAQHPRRRRRVGPARDAHPLVLTRGPPGHGGGRRTARRSTAPAPSTSTSSCSTSRSGRGPTATRSAARCARAATWSRSSC